MVKNDLNKNVDYNKLFVYLEGTRLAFDATTINNKIKQTSDAPHNGHLLDDLLTDIGNVYKAAKSGFNNYEGKKKQIDREFQRFVSENPKLIEVEEAMAIYNQIEKADSTGLVSLLFSISIILDRKYIYTYADESLSFISNMMYGDNSLINIQTNLQNYYKIISNKNELSGSQMALMFGVAIAALAAVTIFPIGAVGGVGAKAPITTTALKAIGFGDMQIGVGMLALSSALLGGALGSGTYLAMKSYNTNKLIEEFRSYSPDQVAMQLAIQIMVIQLFKQKLSTKEFKEKLDKILSDINLLKGDLNHLLFVERNTQLKNKLDMFHGFDKCLSQILGI